METQAASAGEIASRPVGNFSKGETRGDLAAQWHSRPADQRFISLSALSDSVRGRAFDSQTFNLSPADIDVIAIQGDTDLQLSMPRFDRQLQLALTHWSFGQLCSLVGAPASYLRRLPPWVAGMNLQSGLAGGRHGDADIQVYAHAGSLLAATGPTYGRIYDYEVVDAVRTIAGDGIGDTDWKVPGVMDWSTGRYDPLLPITQDTTTLYASDRDVWLFLVDDLHPIEVGKLPSGDPDLLFRGFYAWNSEVGATTMGLATFYLRAVCCNRLLWGVEKYNALSIRHTSGAPARFLAEAAPRLAQFAEADTAAVIAGVTKARTNVIAHDNFDRHAVLAHLGFSTKRTTEILAGCESLSGGPPPASAWDFAQGITLVAQSEPNQNTRVQMEHMAGHLLDKATE